MSNKDEDEKERKLNLLREQVTGLRLSESKQALVMSIQDQIDSLSDDFIVSMGGIIRQPWDYGSSWEVVEANGQARLVRKVTKREDTTTKRAFRVGQPLRIDGGIVPDDVVIREVLGPTRYKVQSKFSHQVYEADEQDLYDPQASDSLFSGGIDIGDLANLF